MSVKCPWCGVEVSKDDYSDHLTEKHYKKNGKKITGPYPAGVKE